MLFDPEERSYNRGRFEYDAIVDDVYIYSYLDADIARLMRLHETLSALKRDVVVLCFAYQVSFLREYFGPMVELKVIDFDTVEDELGPDRRNLLEGLEEDLSVSSWPWYSVHSQCFIWAE